MNIQLLDSKIIVTDDIKQEIKQILTNYTNDKIFILVDQNTRQHCYPIVEEVFADISNIIEIPSGETNKNIDTAMDIWNYLSKKSGDRKSLLINLGGGVLCDLGGFVASAFKRGIDFINIPTTLMAQVDAAIGGKTGINLNNLKNEIGYFCLPKYTIIDNVFLKTLDNRHILSGFVEMLKHALIYDPKIWNNLNKVNPKNVDARILKILVEESISVKKYFVENDPNENNIREALNFGHTIGHAIETFLLDQDIDILHGEAIAIGLICELFLSNKLLNMNIKKILDIINYIIDNFFLPEISPKNFEQIYENMKHDKKNKNNMIHFSLLQDIGVIKTGITCSESHVSEALGFYFQITR